MAGTTQVHGVDTVRFINPVDVLTTAEDSRELRELASYLIGAPKRALDIHNGFFRGVKTYSEVGVTAADARKDLGSLIDKLLADRNAARHEAPTLGIEFGQSF